MGKKPKRAKVEKAKNRSIKMELIVNIVWLVICIVVVIGLITSFFNYRTVMTIIEETFTKIAVSDLDILNHEITTYKNQIGRAVLTRSIAVTILIFALSVALAVPIASRLSKNIAEPIIKCAERIKLLSVGDLHSEVEMFHNNEEIELLTGSLSFTVRGLSNVIKDITYHLGEIENGNFTTSVELDYLGDLDAIEHSLNAIIKSLNDTMSKIDESSNQVASGADEVASGAQILSQGATEQASSIEELAATINEISEQINQNSENAEKAKLASLEAAEEVRKGSYQVHEMTNAMNEINTTSLEIEKIIKDIEDIAFQTNILALNAAVEAARAGSAGKGFAVVADEVRNLASKSAEAAQNTTELIESSLKAVFNGVKIATRTDETLKTVVERANIAQTLVEEIATATQQQATGISQVSIGIEQVSSVVQNNSATAQESAAASEELSSQAQILKGIVHILKFKKDNNNVYPQEAESSE